MLRTGDEYRDSLRDDREVWIKGERVPDVPTHPAFQPIVDVRARIYDMAHEDEHTARPWRTPTRNPVRRATSVTNHRRLRMTGTTNAAPSMQC